MIAAISPPSISTGAVMRMGAGPKATPRGTISPNGLRPSISWRKARTIANTIFWTSDDYYQFMGGLAATVQSLRGKAPRIAHVDTSRPEAPLARPLSHEISRVVRGRAANPKWIAGVMRHGYKGAFEIAATVDYLFGFAASTNAVSNHHFDQLFAAYLEDERVRDFMQEANPAALRETAARFAEAIRRGLWTPRSNRAAHLVAELLPEAQKEIA